MGRDDAVGRAQQGICPVHWLSGDHIHSRTPELPATQRMGHRLLVDQRPTGGVDEDRAVLHFVQIFLVDDTLRLRCQRAV